MMHLVFEAWYASPFLLFIPYGIRRVQRLFTDTPKEVAARYAEKEPSEEEKLLEHVKWAYCRDEISTLQLEEGIVAVLTGKYMEWKNKIDPQPANASPERHRPPGQPAGATGPTGTTGVTGVTGVSPGQWESYQRSMLDKMENYSSRPGHVVREYAYHEATSGYCIECQSYGKVHAHVIQPESKKSALKLTQKNAGYSNKLVKIEKDFEALKKRVDLFEDVPRPARTNPSQKIRR